MKGELLHCWIHAGEKKKKKHLICCKTGIGTDLLRFQVARYDSFFFKQTRHSAAVLPLLVLLFYYSLSGSFVLLYTVSCCIAQSLSVFPGACSQSVCLI